MNRWSANVKLFSFTNISSSYVYIRRPLRSSWTRSAAFRRPRTVWQTCIFSPWTAWL